MACLRNTRKNSIVSPRGIATIPRHLPLRRSRRSYGNYQSSQSFVSSRIFLKRLGRSGRSYRKQALDVLSGVVNDKSTGNFQFSDASVLASMGSRLALFLRGGSGRTLRKPKQLPTSDFRRTFSALEEHRQCLSKRPLFISSRDAEPL